MTIEIVDFPSYKMVIFQFVMLVYQRVQHPILSLAGKLAGLMAASRKVRQRRRSSSSPRSWREVAIEDGHL